MARLRRDEWVDAAYELFQAEGLAAVRVEVLARILGATKGSFYWHLTDRRDLLRAVLDRWEQSETEGVIAAAAEDLAPVDRLAVLFHEIARHSSLRTGERTLYVDSPSLGVADTVLAVTERRAGFVASVLSDLGLSDEEARRRAVVVVSSVLGYQQVTASAWEARTDPYELVETLFHFVIAGTAAASDGAEVWRRAQQA